MKNFKVKKIKVTKDKHVKIKFRLKQDMEIYIEPKYDDDLDEDVVSVDVDNITEEDIMGAIENECESELGDMFLSSLK